jgi:hypothetical protein
MNLLTKRIPTILGLLLLILGIFGAYYYFQNNGSKVAAELTPKKVRITNIADNKFSVSWTSDVATVGSVEYGKIGEKLTTKKMDDRDSGNTQGAYTTHHVTIEGLQPSTQYAFRIVVGEKSTRFDNTGSPYTTSTGPVVGATPTSQNFYGSVQQPSKQPASGAIVYVTLPGGATASSLVGESGNYAITLSTMRSSDLKSYVKYDPTATVVSVTVESGNQQSVASVALANSAPVPTITLGQDAEFLTVPETPAIAEVTPDASPVATDANKPETPSIFNVEPLGSTPDVNAVTSGSVTLLNPKENGETLATLRPEFRGTGPKGTTLSIALTGQKAVSDTLQVATDGTWSWAPVIDLKAGKQKISVSYVDTSGSTQKVEREFTISATKAGIDPAFVSSPSASTAGSASKTATPSATARAAMPDTTDGTPVSGVIENTLLTAGAGIVIMVLGAVLLAL